MRKITKRRYYWNFKRFLRNATLLVLIIAGCWLTFSSATGAGATPEEVIIRTGDSLWTVAVRIRPQNDPRKTIEDIRMVNNLTTMKVTPGQMIIVP